MSNKQLAEENKQLKNKIAELEASIQAFLEEQEQYKLVIEQHTRTAQFSNRGISNRIINESRAALQRRRDEKASQ